MRFFRIPVPVGDALIFPDCYFEDFSSCVRVLPIADLKNSKNAEIVRLQQNSCVFKTAAQCNASFLLDLRRSLQIVFLSAMGERKIIFTPEEAVDLTDDQLLPAVFERIAKHRPFSHETLENLEAAYHQSILYFIKNIIENALKETFFTQNFQCQSDLVFKENGQISLDIYQVKYQMVSHTLEFNYLPLNVICNANVVAYIPFLTEEKVFAKPIIIFDSKFMPFLYANREIAFNISMASSQEEPELSLRKSIDTTLKERSQRPIKTKEIPEDKKALFIIKTIMVLILVSATFSELGTVGSSFIDTIFAAFGTTTRTGSIVVGSMSSAGYLIFKGIIESEKNPELNLEEYRIDNIAKDDPQNTPVY